MRNDLLLLILLAAFLSGCTSQAPPIVPGVPTGIPGVTPPTNITYDTNATERDPLGRDILVLPYATSGQFYRWQIIPSGGKPPYRCAIANDSSLPGTLVLDADCQILGGAPKVPQDTTLQTFPFKFTITDSQGRTSVFEQVIRVRQLPPKLTVPERLPEAVIGEPYPEYWLCDPPERRTQLHCGGLIQTKPSDPSIPVPALNPFDGVPPYTFSANGLPLGLSIGSNGMLKGTVKEGTTPGERSVEICVTDFGGRTTCGNTVILIKEKVKKPTTTPTPPPPALQLISPAGVQILSANVDKYYSYSFSASGGRPPYRFSTTSSLPYSLRLSSGGSLTGTVERNPPLRAGEIPTSTSLQIKVCVTDSENNKDCKTMTLTIFRDLPKLDLFLLGLETFTRGYSELVFVDVKGGTPPYEFKAYGLPFGIKIEERTYLNSAQISGTVDPNYNVPGRQTVQICVTDADGFADCQSTRIEIR